MKRDTRQAYRRRAADTERMVDGAVAAVASERAADWQASKERAADIKTVLAAKPAVDPATIQPGMWVLNRRTFAGQVVKVNRTTATVNHMGFETRWPLDSIIAATNPKEQSA